MNALERLKRRGGGQIVECPSGISFKIRPITPAELAQYGGVQTALSMQVSGQLLQKVQQEGEAAKLGLTEEAYQESVVMPRIMSQLEKHPELLTGMSDIHAAWICAGVEALRIEDDSGTEWVDVCFVMSRGDVDHDANRLHVTALPADDRQALQDAIVKLSGGGLDLEPFREGAGVSDLDPQDGEVIRPETERAAAK